ncbi:MAG: LacI family DNA-binding transcriptional regulator [Phycisphaerae bacterium]
MTSVRQIAKHAGVSISTVSRALNNDPGVREATQQKVLETANRLGFVSAVGRRVTTNIALVYFDKETASCPFDQALQRGILRGLDEARFDLLILDVHRDKAGDESFTQFFLRKGVRGVLVRATQSDRHICKAIADEGFPAVVLCERFETGNANFIGCDSREESARAVEYLIALGHRRIAFGMHSVQDNDHLDRLQAYQQAMTKHGLPVDDRLVLRLNANFAGGATAMKMMRSLPDPPSAIFFADPLLALGAINAAHELQIKVPNDIAIVGFDDADLRHTCFPSITAVCQDTVRLGYEAAMGLTRLIQRDVEGPVQVTLPTYFEVNQSSGPPPEMSI